MSHKSGKVTAAQPLNGVLEIAILWSRFLSQDFYADGNDARGKATPPPSAKLIIITGISRKNAARWVIFGCPVADCGDVVIPCRNMTLRYGRAYKEIGQKLFLSLNTVQFHVKNIDGKWAVNKRVQAIEKARALNLIRSRRQNYIFAPTYSPTTKPHICLSQNYMVMWFFFLPVVIEYKGKENRIQGGRK
jgi:hypothetical protein